MALRGESSERWILIPGVLKITCGKGIANPEKRRKRFLNAEIYNLTQINLPNNLVLTIG